MLAGIAGRQKFLGRSPELFASGAGVDRRLEIEEARENASAVRFDDRHRGVERERSDGIGSVAADPRQRGDRIEGAGEFAPVFFDDRDSRGAKVPGARIITEALPGVEDLAFRSRGERSEIRKAPEPFIVIRNDGGDLGLLEHELGDEDGVGVGGAAPGQVAGIFAIPGEDGTPECPRARFSVRVDGRKRRTPNAERPTPNAEFFIRDWTLGVGRSTFALL
ncbi:MAG: hypothetical protein QOI07_2395 [Verrucomicrobiota bacterium]